MGKYINTIYIKKHIDENSYLKKLPAISYLEQVEALSFSETVTFLVGENGTGKSTLLEGIAVACGFNAEGGTRNFNFSTNNTHSELHEHLGISRKAHARDGFFLRAESLYNVATNIDEMDSETSFQSPIINSYGGVSLHRQSHGESFLALVQNRFGGNGLYLLDEPEAALSPNRLMALMLNIHKLVQKNSQFIIATHSPILMAFPGAAVYEFSEQGIAAVNYRETEHYKITKQFLENPEKMLRYLFND